MSATARLVGGWRLAVGTLTAIPIRPPSGVGREVVGPAMMLAPVAVAPLGALVAALCWLGTSAGVARPALAFLVLAAVALGTRAFHLDGLADTADGLTSSYDRDRALAVMHTGDTGPAGAAAVVITLGVQAGAIAGLLELAWGPVLIGLALCVSRGALLLTCARPVRSARPDGLGAGVAGSVPVIGALILGLVLTAVVAAGATVAGMPWWRGPIAMVVALLAVAWLTRRAIHRLGGVSGDIFGAAIEVAFAALLLALS